MSYCSLEEAYGTEFCQQVNNNYMLGSSTPYNVSKMNPTRNDMYLPGSRHGTEISRVKYAQDSKQNALIQASQDTQIHRQSFDSISGVIPRSQNTKNITPWGDEIDYDENQSVDETSPIEVLLDSATVPLALSPPTRISAKPRPASAKLTVEVGFVVASLKNFTIPSLASRATPTNLRRADTSAVPVGDTAVEATLDAVLA